MAQITIDAELTDKEAWALAQFLKRISWDEVRRNAVSDDDAHVMLDALGKVRNGVNRAGFDPR